jgi:glycosyltransferase involved in cell wall biosynthesis
VFLMSSDYEGVSIAVLEAMRAGLPVVATSVGGMPETVRHGETGWLVPGGDLAAYVAALREALDDPARRRARGEAGRKLQQQEFSIEHTARRYLDLYSAGRA